jgi:hypothetical protein
LYDASRQHYGLSDNTAFVLVCHIKFMLSYLCYVHTGGHIVGIGLYIP